jgi:hypothetical protein
VSLDHGAVLKPGSGPRSNALDEERLSGGLSGLESHSGPGCA